ncbi:MAG: response regulator transcription factor [Acidobacteria bacterium]|nr:response regulator transcription factor [Acidobacteriota bacterium]
MIRLLLVDDHGTLRDALKLLLDAEPDLRVVGEACDGEQAIESVAALRPDVVIMDLSMPGTGGLEAVRRLHRANASARVIVLTRHDDSALVLELLHAGAEGYVLKQSPSAELLRGIRAVAAGARYVDSRLPRAGEPKRRPTTPPVSGREQEILRLIARGYSNKEIAAQLDLSVKTVEVHKANAMRKLGFHGRADVVRFAVMNGWLTEA